MKQSASPRIWIAAGLSLLFSAAFLLILSKSSPLYPLNDWVDVNCFFTMGRSMLHGKVLYRDLYEQKGPVLYFVFALSALISEHSYIGVFLVEVVCFALFLFFAGRITALYTDDLLLQSLVMLLSAALIPLTRSFSHGNSVEELNLFPMAFTLWQLLRLSKDGRPVSPAATAGIGIACSAAFWSKYTICGFYAGILLAVCLLYPLKRIPLNEFLKSVLFFLIGFFGSSLLVLFYFAVNGALKDLYTVYFYNNLTLYPQESADKASSILSAVSSMLSVNPPTSWCLWAAAAWSIVSAIRRRPGELIVLGLSFALLAVSTYIGGRPYSYYGLIFAAFVPAGLAGIAELLDFAVRGGRKADAETPDGDAPPRVRGRKRTGLILPAALTVLFLFAGLLVFARGHGRNVYLLGTDRADTPPYIFAEVMKETEDPTLLNYGFLDGGFYYAAGIVPDCRFFCTLNISGTDMWDVQADYIDSGDADYVVTRQYRLDHYRVDSGAFEQVSTATLYFEGRDYTYYLYRRKDLSR